MPQSAMSSDMAALSFAFIWSRDESASSKFISPTIERSDVCTNVCMAIT